jgi:hypothetical protein
MCTCVQIKVAAGVEGGGLRNRGQFIFVRQTHTKDLVVHFRTTYYVAPVTQTHMAKSHLGFGGAYKDNKLIRTCSPEAALAAADMVTTYTVTTVAQMRTANSHPRIGGALKDNLLICTCSPDAYGKLTPKLWWCI